MSGTFEITKRFSFEAAHHFPQMPEGHPYRRLHGHSFEVEVTIEGKRNTEQGWVLDFEEMDKLLGQIKERLCHGYLNEIEGLENPSLENIAFWIADKAEAQLNGIKAVKVMRPSCGEACTYRP